MPQPIDMQTEVARTLAAERILQAQDRANLTAQQRQAMEQQRIRIQQESQAGEVNETEDQTVDPGGAGAGEPREEHGNSSEDENAAGPSPRKAPSIGAEGRHLDVSI